jgi:hypothetical protein
LRGKLAAVLKTIRDTQESYELLRGFNGAGNSHNDRGVAQETADNDNFLYSVKKPAITVDLLYHIQKLIHRFFGGLFLSHCPPSRVKDYLFGTAIISGNKS